MEFTTLAELLNWKNPIQVLISLGWAGKAELKRFMKVNGIKPTHNENKNLATMRLAFRGVVLLSNDEFQIEQVNKGWMFGKDNAIYNGTANNYSQTFQLVNGDYVL